MQTKRAGRNLGLAALMGALAVLPSCGGGSLVITVTPPAAATPADGVTAAVITITVKQGKTLVPDANGGNLSLSIDKGQFGPYDSTGPAQDDPGQQTSAAALSNGTAKIQIYSRHTANTVLTVNYTDSVGSIATQTANIPFGNVNQAQPASIKYISATPTSIALQGAPGPQTSAVVFEVDDSSGAPVGDGINVVFTLSQTVSGANAASITPTSAKTANGTGQVQTVLSSSATPQTVTITATVTGITPATSPSIAIAGGAVDLGSMTFSCDTTTIGGFQNDGLTTNCTVYASDRNKAYVPGTSVTFMTEAGGLPPSAITAPSQDPATHGQGQAQVTYTTQCPWPEDVDPNQDPDDFPNNSEYSKSNVPFYNHCALPGSEHETRTVNRRDGWVDMVAYTTGEECFNDVNGNGIYDGPQEYKPSCDEGEPYVDINDNGKYDGPGSANLPANLQASGEPFFDYNQNGVWDPPDGKWTALGAIWVHNRMVWTGSAGTHPNGNISTENPGTFYFDPATVPTKSHCSVPVAYLFSYDINGNCPSATSTGDSINFNCTGDCDIQSIPLQGCSGYQVGEDTNYPTLPAQAVPIGDPDCGCEQAGTCTLESYAIGVTIDRTMDEGGTTEEITYTGPGGAFGPN